MEQVNSWTVVYTLGGRAIFMPIYCIFTIWKYDYIIIFIWHRAYSYIYIYIYIYIILMYAHVSKCISVFSPSVIAFAGYFAMVGK